MQLLHDSLPEFVGSLMTTTVLAGGGWSVKKTRDRLRRARRARRARRTASEVSLVRSGEDTDMEEAGDTGRAQAV
ncbi:hypothetical protein ACFZA1_37945 [Streptomyces filipinensis]|uniref:hypothetical protein n=1 Tax=Streptomyces filipinensis TaxID=66887 RepID=UPI0036EC7378